jgi:hypothetical protein
MAFGGTTIKSTNKKTADIKTPISGKKKVPSKGIEVYTRKAVAKGWRYAVSHWPQRVI